MGFLGFGKKDPTRDWGPERAVALVLDLRACALNGLALGQPFSELSRFGRPANPKAYENGAYLYPSLGLEVETDPERNVATFGLVLVETQWDSVGGCRPTVIVPGGASVVVTPESKVTALLAHLPPPIAVESDGDGERDAEDDDEEDGDDVEDEDDGVTYRFRLSGGRELELEASREGALRRLNLNAAV